MNNEEIEIFLHSLIINSFIALQDLMVVLPGVPPPLPIPNRAVKPPMANGTAQQCGRVGSRHILL